MNMMPGIKGIPWVKLYLFGGTQVGGTPVCDLQYDLYMNEGRLEFVVPDVESDYYFLLSKSDEIRLWWVHCY